MDTLNKPQQDLVHPLDAIAFRAGALQAHVEILLGELEKADQIIHAMLPQVPAPKQAKLARSLEQAGVSPDGMTRNLERHLAIDHARDFLGSIKK